MYVDFCTWLRGESQVEIDGILLETSQRAAGGTERKKDKVHDDTWNNDSFALREKCLAFICKLWNLKK